MKHYLVYLAPVAVLAAPAAHATVYLTTEQAQAQMFPGETLQPVAHTMTDEQMTAIRRDSGESPLSNALKAWRSASGGWFILDEVLGKHEYITYAVSLDAAGAVRDIEIMDYRETYGGDVRDPKWRAQFTGKSHGAAMTLGDGVQNISGATLSCKHITDGVRRILATYAIVLAHA